MLTWPLDEGEDSPVRVDQMWIGKKERQGILRSGVAGQGSRVEMNTGRSELVQLSGLSLGPALLELPTQEKPHS